MKKILGFLLVASLVFTGCDLFSKKKSTVLIGTPVSSYPYPAGFSHYSTVKIYSENNFSQEAEVVANKERTEFRVKYINEWYPASGGYGGSWHFYDKYGDKWTFNM